MGEGCESFRVCAVRGSVPPSTSSRLLLLLLLLLFLVSCRRLILQGDPPFANNHG